MKLKNLRFLIIFVGLLLLNSLHKEKVYAVNPINEIPNFINADSFYSTNEYDEFFSEDVEVIFENEEQEREYFEADLAEGLEIILDYLSTSVAIEENTSTIIAGNKMICDEITGELEQVSTVYSTNLLVNKVITLAITKQGCRYSQPLRETVDTYDCSSFVRRMYKEISGVYIGNTASDIKDTLWNYQVPMNDLQPGDLVWYPGHIAMYIGNGQIIHAAGVKKGVLIADMYASFTKAFRPINYIKDIKGSSAAKQIIYR